MSTYYTWVNYTKRQYLCDVPFPEGLKILESSYVDSPKTDAATTLLAGPWRGDPVAFAADDLDDYGAIMSLPGYAGLSRVMTYPIDSYDIEYEFKEVAGRLTYCRGKSGNRVVANPEPGGSQSRRHRTRARSTLR